MIELFNVYENDTIEKVLKKIDANKKGFVIVVDTNMKVLGTISDGDIRRQILAGKTIDDAISFSSKFESVHMDDDFHSLSEKFKFNHIDFLPIINKSGKLRSVITKKQFHSLMLRDKKWSLKDDSFSIDEDELDYEIFSRPWGFYKSTLLSEHVQSKVITLFPKSELSYQKHKKREEHWIVIKGTGSVLLEESTLDVYPGKYIFIPKGCKHQMINSSETDNLIFAEVQLGDYFGEDDIIRYKDIYGRVNTKGNK